MTLIKDLIEIPERVQKGDFVLKLTEGVTRADATLRDYVDPRTQRLLRQRQKPLHGRAQPHSPGHSRRQKHPRTRPRHHQAQ